MLIPICVRKSKLCETCARENTCINVCVYELLFGEVDGDLPKKKRREDARRFIIETMAYD